ncbi:MAG: PilN domain-containing protein [Candidatus Saccharimonadales bacterium]
MINLLPPEHKQTLFYSKRNRTMSRWVIALLIALVFSLMIVGAGWLYLDQAVKREAKNVEQTETVLKEQEIDETTAKVDEISNNTKLVLEVLSREILFSKLIRQLGAALPTGTALESITLEGLQGGLTIQANATDFNTASQIQVNLSDPQNKIFKQADIETISCPQVTEEEAGSDEASLYPCTVRLKALFSDNTEFVYIGSEE